MVLVQPCCCCCLLRASPEPGPGHIPLLRLLSLGTGVLEQLLIPKSFWEWDLCGELGDVSGWRGTPAWFSQVKPPKGVSGVGLSGDMVTSLGTEPLPGHPTAPALLTATTGEVGRIFFPAESTGRRSDMNTAGGFDGDSGVHNVLPPQCAKGLHSCSLRALPLHPRALTSTQHRGRGEATLTAAKIPDFGDGVTSRIASSV